MGSKKQEADLYCLPDEWPEGLAGQYAVCENCLERYPTPADWLEWAAVAVR